MSAALAVLAGLCVALAPWWPALLAGAGLGLAGVVVLNRRLFSLFVRRRGLVFAAACVPLHLLYYLYSAASYALVWVAWHVGSSRRGRRSRFRGGESRERGRRPGTRVVVIGAGPAGLTAAYELAKLGLRPIVLEKERIVGGLARTEKYKGFHFDMGGHRFFTKSEEVKKMWHEVLGDEFLRRPRLSRIYYNGKFFHYPLKPFNALRGLGLWQSVLIVLSYLRWQLFPYPREDTFEQWVTNRFGRRLFLTFFKTYTEKVWGISCSELKAEWAAQRIKDLSLKTALLSMFLKPKTTIKTLIEEFDYPRLGPGMMWEAVKEPSSRAAASCA